MMAGKEKEEGVAEVQRKRGNSRTRLYLLMAIRNGPIVDERMGEVRLSILEQTS